MLKYLKVGVGKKGIEESSGSKKNSTCVFGEM